MLKTLKLKMYNINLTSFFVCLFVYGFIYVYYDGSPRGSYQYR